MSDRPAQFKIDLGAALEAVEAATFGADELLNCVLTKKLTPPGRRIDALKDAAEILHHSYHAMRSVRWAFDRRDEWHDRAGQALQMTSAPLSYLIEKIQGAKSHLALAFFIFEVGADTSHWSNIDRGKYAAAFERVAIALEKIKFAAASLSSLLPLQALDRKN